MKKRNIPGKSDLESIRKQILGFTCVAYDFRAETDEFHHNGDWNGKFVVEFRDHPEEERLHYEAPSGEHFVRFRMDIEVDAEIWEKEHENIHRVASRYDVAVDPTPVEGEGGRFLTAGCQL